MSLIPSAPFTSRKDTAVGFDRSLLRPALAGLPQAKNGYDRSVTSIYLCFVSIRGNHESVNRLSLDESIHNLRDVRNRNAPVKKVIGFD